jgi:hypothetical protein
VVLRNFSGKVECSSYLCPYRTGKVMRHSRHGDRIFSMTQDDELVISFFCHLRAPTV